MAKRTVAPTCKYGHGNLSICVQPDGSTSIFSAPAIINRTLQIGQGYTFTIWECPVCTYIEFHDYDFAIPPV